MEKSKWQKAFGEDVMPIGAYCSPQPATVYNGVEYPTKITEKHYQMLADMGVNLVYGHVEQIGTESEPLVFEALDFCNKAGIKYLVRDCISYQYVANGLNPDERGYQSLTQEEKENLHKTFI